MSLRLNGSTSGYVEIDAPAVAGTTSITIPATTGGQFVVTDSSGNVNLDSGTLYVDAVNNRVGVGTASPQGTLEVRAASAGATIRLTRPSSADYELYASSDTFIITDKKQSAERLRIDNSGRLLVGTSSYSTSNPGVVIYNPGDDSGRIDVIKTQSGILDSITNYHNGSYVGGLTYSNTATALVTSSDVRLKKDITDAPSATSMVNQIRVVSHGWIHDDAQVQYGVIAQELYQTVPDAVRVGDDGEKVEKTWGVDYSKLVPVLTKALQEALERIETLEAKVAALEVTP